VHFPRLVKPGVTNSLVSAIDISATILDIVGAEKPPSVQGVSFARVLSDTTAVTRNVAFAEHNWHVYRNHERMVRCGDWLYIRNNYAEKQNLCVEAYMGGAGEELWEMHKAGKLQAEQLGLFQVPCPKEELYDTAQDSQQLHNLANDPTYALVLKQMRATLQQWTAQTGDTIPRNPTPDRDAPPGAPSKDRKDFKHLEMPGDATRAQEMNHPGPVLLDTVPSDQTA
jgi:N-sulfoglucosamine sulfohydrolase